jgi:hypothetical protein
VTLAAGAHSIYGTSSFRTTDGNVAQRDEVRALIGERAELLVYGFHRLERRGGWWKNFTGFLTDRETKKVLPPELLEVAPLLREIEACNLIEQGGMV